MIYSVIPDIVSLILVPVLIVLLVLVLILLVAKRKTDTLAQLAFALKKLIESCDVKNPDLKTLKKLDMDAAKCALLSERATFEQKLDVGRVPERIDSARKILHALHDAKTPSDECGEFLALAKKELSAAYRFLINTLGITAAPAFASLGFFKKNIRNEKARAYLDSLKETPRKEPEATENEETNSDN